MRKLTLLAWGALLIVACGPSAAQPSTPTTPKEPSPSAGNSQSNLGSTDLRGNWLGTGSQKQVVIQLNILESSPKGELRGEAVLPLSPEGSGPYVVQGQLSSVAGVPKLSIKILKSVGKQAQSVRSAQQLQQLQQAQQWQEYYRLSCDTTDGAKDLALWNCELVNVPRPEEGLSNERVSRLQLKRL